MSNYYDTKDNIGADGDAVPGIPEGLSQPGGAGTDIIVTNIVGGGYKGYTDCFHFIFGYFAKGTPAGTYHFTSTSLKN